MQNISEMLQNQKQPPKSVLSDEMCQEDGQKPESPESEMSGKLKL